MDKKVLLIAGGVGAAALVGFAVIGGQSSSSGASFSAPDPQSVSAVETAATNEADLAAQEAQQRMSTAANLALGLASLQQSINLAQIDQGTNEYDAAQQTQQVGLQTSAGVTENAANDAAALQKAQLDDAAAEAVSNSVANANTAIATITGNVNEQLATTAANASDYAASQGATAAEQISTNQMNAENNAANAASSTTKAVSKNNVIGNIFSGILGIFGL